MRIATILLALTMIGLGAAVILPRLDETRGVPVDVHTVARGDIEWIVRAEGRIEARQEANLAFEVAGRLASIEVHRGQNVERGQVIARLDDATLRVVEKSALLELAGTKTRLTELKAGTRPEEIEEVRARIEGAAAELEQARRDHEKSAQLFEQKALDRRTLEHDKVRAETARSRLRALEKRLRLLEAGPRREEIERAAIDVESAAVHLEEIRLRMEKMTLRAPFSGRVTLRYLDPGEMASPERPVVTVSETEHLEAVLEVDEYDVGALKPGLAARISSRALPGVLFRGKVAEVGELVGKRRARGDDPAVIYDSRVIETRVPLGADPRLRPGMTIEGEIAVVRRADVLCVPLRAVLTDEDGKMSIRMVDGGARVVRLGIRDRRDAEVLEGLRPGDTIRIPTGR